MLALGYISYYIIALFGISIGYHRYFSHNTFQTNKYTEVAMLFAGLICGGRSLLTWASVHRMHHAHSDTELDPHSPKFINNFKVIFSLWKVKVIPRKYIKDLMRNPRVIFFHRYGKWILCAIHIIMAIYSVKVWLILLVIPYFLAWINFGLLNYFAHKSGEPVNNPWLNLIAPGEGWHKVHHTSPRSYKLSQYDPSGVIIEVIRTK